MVISIYSITSGAVIGNRMRAYTYAVLSGPEPLGILVGVLMKSIYPICDMDKLIYVVHRVVYTDIIYIPLL